MNSKIIGVTLALAFTFLAQTSLSVSAQGNTQAKSVSVKFGYFNLALVKASYPPASNSEILKAQAESKLREEIKNAQEELDGMKSSNKSEAEIKKFLSDSQIKISAKQQAYTEILVNQSNQVKVSIAKAVDAVAKDKGLDLVLDAQGIFAGGKTVLDNGVDITREVVAKLNPNAASSSSAPVKKNSSPASDTN